jgi:hypothetical protein
MVSIARQSTLFCVLIGVALTGCASGNSAPSGEVDASTPDASMGADAGADANGPDASAPDAAIPDATPPDAMRGMAGTCESCEGFLDCQDGYYCAELGSGGRACLPTCNPDIPECPPRFECVRNFTDGIPEPVCAPVGERCCIDGDGDLYGEGVGCLGSDCDDTLATIHEGAPEICNGADDDCDTMTDEGDPNVLCPRGPHVAETACTMGMCELVACEMSYADCNMMSVDGCETYLRSLTDCVTCGTLCERDHASESCESGMCQLISCEAGWGDCDRMDPTGCETPLNTVTNCGRCDNRCSFPNGSARCDGTCRLDSCNSGFSNCDGNETNGCELNHAAVAGACGGGGNAGTYDGDRSCGTGFLGTCEGNTSWDLFSSFTGTSSGWFRARVREDSLCSADIEHRVRLEVPAGVDYDLYLHKVSCGSTPSSSLRGTGADESITIREGESSGSDDDFNYYVEVRYVSGASCVPWTLRFYGHDC